MITGITTRSIIICFILAVIATLAAYHLFMRERLTVSAAVTLPFLISYLYLVLAITILDRTPGRDYKYELELFWSYKAAMAGASWLWMEDFLNVVLFIPGGFFLSILIEERRRFVVPVAAIFSATIEITQLVTKRGLFEFDDIFHNTLGAMVGVFLFFVCRKGQLYGEKYRHWPSGL